MFLVLFVFNKDHFGSKRSRSSLFKSKSVLFCCFSVVVRFSLFFVLCNFIEIRIVQTFRLWI
jgi:hypothetical protein